MSGAGPSALLALVALLALAGGGVWLDRKRCGTWLTPFAALAAPLTWWIARVDSVLPLLWLILILRFVNRSTGLPPKLTDALGLILLAGWLSWARMPLFGILTGVVLVLDVLPRRPLWPRVCTGR